MMEVSKGGWKNNIREVITVIGLVHVVFVTLNGVCPDTSETPWLCVFPRSVEVLIERGIDDDLGG